jgi:pimeloyl-ACP methyl ester carboxylesterase
VRHVHDVDRDVGFTAKNLTEECDSRCVVLRPIHRHQNLRHLGTPPSIEIDFTCYYRTNVLVVHCALTRPRLLRTMLQITTRAGGAMMTGDANALTTDLNGLEFRYWDWGIGAGTGRQVVLLHGLASNARFWDLSAPSLTGELRVVALDERGHGLSAKPDDGYDFPTVAGDVATFIQELGLERPVLIGHSWGGNVALQVAADHSQLVGGVACIDGGFIEPSAREGATLESTLEELAPPDFSKFQMTWDQMLERSRNWGAAQAWGDKRIHFLEANFYVTDDGIVMPRLSRERHLKIVRALWDQRVSDLYPAIQAPVLWMPVRQTGDDYSSAGWRAEKEASIEKAVSLLPSTRVHWMEDSIHDVPVQKPEEVAEVILRHVREGFFGND